MSYSYLCKIKYPYIIYFPNEPSGSNVVLALSTYKELNKVIDIICHVAIKDSFELLKPTIISFKRLE